jgi:hypothetical protein
MEGSVNDDTRYHSRLPDLRGTVRYECLRWQPRRECVTLCVLAITM